MKQPRPWKGDLVGTQIFRIIMKPFTSDAGERAFTKMSEAELLVNYNSLIKRDYTGDSLKEVSEYYFKHIPVLPRLRYLNPKHFRPQTFYRANKYAGIPTHLDMISFPDPRRGIKVSRGRANWEGLPVLYGCSGGAGALKEVNAQDGELIILGKWIVDFSKLSAGFLASRFRTAKSDFLGMRDYMINTFCKKGPTVDTKRMLLLDIWNDLFLAPVYDISAFISWVLLYAPGEAFCDYIVYPSIAENLNVINYAIHPKIVHAKIAYPKKFLAFWFEKDFGHSRFIAVGHPYGDEIKWSGKIEDVKEAQF